MTPSVSVFLQALGKPHIDPAVVEILSQLGLSQKKIRLKKGDFDSGFEAPTHGIDVNFSDPQDYSTVQPMPEGALILSAIFFHNAVQGGHHQYPHPLPARLKFNQSRSDVRQLLGNPEFISPILPVDRWSWNGIKLAVHYVEDESCITYLSCFLPSRSLP